MIVHGKPSFYLGRGTLSLRVDRIRAVGLGELLARIERLRRLLAAEGLFDPSLKRRPPLLPHTIGLVTGRDSAAEHDVVRNATARWPRCGSGSRTSPYRAGWPWSRSSARCGRSTATRTSRSSCSPAAAAASRTCCPSPTRRCAAPSPPAGPRSCRPSGTSRTPRWSTTSPTCAAPPRPRPDAAWSPTSPRRPRGSPGCATGPAEPCTAGSTASSTASTTCDGGRCSPTRCAWSPPGRARSPTPAPPPTARCCAGWTGRRRSWSTWAPDSPRSARPRPWRAATRSCSSPTAPTTCPRSCGRSPTRPPAPACGSGSPTAPSPPP